MGPKTSLGQLEGLYRVTTTPQFIEVPELVFLALDGHGDPNTTAGFAQAFQALYAVSDAVKFAIKRSGGADHEVSPLEALWRAEDMSSLSVVRKADWNWNAMIRQPDRVGADMVARLAEEAAAKKGMPARELRMQRFAEGHAGQVMHIGPYAAEGPAIAWLHAFIHEHGSASMDAAASTTRSTSATHDGADRNGSRPSSRSPSPGLPSRHLMRSHRRTGTASGEGHTTRAGLVADAVGGRVPDLV